MQSPYATRSQVFGAIVTAAEIEDNKKVNTINSKNNFTLPLFFIPILMKYVL